MIENHWQKSLVAIIFFFGFPEFSGAVGQLNIGTDTIEIFETITITKGEEDNSRNTARVLKINDKTFLRINLSIKVIGNNNDEEEKDKSYRKSLYDFEILGIRMSDEKSNLVKELKELFKDLPAYMDEDDYSRYELMMGNRNYELPSVIDAKADRTNDRFRAGNLVFVWSRLREELRKELVRWDKNNKFPLSEE